MTQRPAGEDRIGVNCQPLATATHRFHRGSVAVVRLNVAFELLVLAQLLIALPELAAVWRLLVQRRATTVYASAAHALGLVGIVVGRSQWRWLQAQALTW